MKKITCFVAMAFGRDDVDSLFERAIKPVVKELMGTIPVRVDRIWHFKEINQLIVEEIKAADFMIADLSYARPSVYYEAGFAERVIPVIYTCRKDLIDGHSDDKKVHFDLRMKQIIDWQPNQTENFQERLKSKIKKATISLIDSRKAKEQISRREVEFNNISIHEKKSKLNDSAKKYLKELGFGKVYSRRRYDDKARLTDMYFKYTDKTRFFELFVRTENLFSRSTARELLRRVGLFDTYDVAYTSPLEEFVCIEKLKFYTVAMLLISIKKITKDAAQSMFPSFDVVEKKDIKILSYDPLKSKTNRYIANTTSFRSLKNKSIKYKIFLLDGVCSFFDIESRFRQSLAFEMANDVALYKTKRNRYDLLIKYGDDPQKKLTIVKK